MAIFKRFLQRYPGESAVLIFALLLSGVANSIGLSALLPVLNLAFENEVPESGVERVAIDALQAVGLSPDLGLLLLIILGAIVLKNAMVLRHALATSPLTLQRACACACSRVSSAPAGPTLRANRRGSWPTP